MSQETINLLIIFGLVILVKLTINLSRYLTCIRYHKMYNANLKKPEWKIEEIQPQIAKLFKEAGIEDSHVPYVEPVGYNHIITTTVSALENIGTRRQDVVQNITAMFHRAKGIYRGRMLDAINPLYWLMLIIYLPKNLFQYVGASPEGIGVKIAQVIYWLLATIGGLIVTLFGNEINAYIKEIITPR